MSKDSLAIDLLKILKQHCNTRKIKAEFTFAHVDKDGAASTVTFDKEIDINPDIKKP